MKNIYLIGDIHSDITPIASLYNTLLSKGYSLSDKTDVVVLLGDAGLNYYMDKRDSNFKRELSSYPFTYFVIRGNHDRRVSSIIKDNQEAWSTQITNFGTCHIEKDFPNIYYALDDVNLYHFDNRSVLVIPGAYSVDKDYRLKRKWMWESQEQLDEVEKEAGLRLIEEIGNSVDIVLTHTCPSKYMPRDLFNPMFSNINYATENYLDEIDDILKYKIWLFGHYHDTRVIIDRQPNVYVHKNSYTCFLKKKQLVLLYCNIAFDLNQFFIDENPYDSLFEIT